MQSKNIIEIKKPVDPELVANLEELVEQAKKGEIVGVTAVLLHPPSDYNYISLGDMSFSEVIMAFENFKFDQFAMRYTGKGK